MKDNNILIVDDESDICWALQIALEDEGVNIVQVTRGEDAIKEVKEKNFRVALIDVKLPGINGIEVSQLIREIDSKIKVIILSGYLYEDDEVIREGISRGDFAGFINKPFELEAVQALVKKVL